MNQTASFVITPFTNPSGEIVFRVTGWLDGKRVRKNFRTRSEADAERQILEVQCAQGETGIRHRHHHTTDAGHVCARRIPSRRLIDGAPAQSGKRSPGS